MCSNTYNISEDWGWFIDIETSKPIYEIKTEFIKNKNKKLNYNYNRLYPIEEDEYDYYINNYKDIETIEKIKPPIEITKTDIIAKYGSTTLISALLTCIVFFVL